MRAAIIGLGRWGRILVSSVQGLSERIQFTAGVTRTPGKAAEFAKRHGIPLGDDYARVLDDPAIDAVVLATPHSQHADQVVAAAAAGKHIFVEKPFTLTEAGAKKAVKAAGRAGRVLALGHDRRFLPAMAELRRRLADGALGQALHVEANFSGSSGFGYKGDQWRASATETPSGGMAGSGIHMVDAMIGLFGPIERVYAQSLRQVLMDDIDDTTSMLFGFENGMSGYLAALSATGSMWRLQVFGSKGWAEIRDERRLEVRLIGAESEVIDYPPFDTRRAELEAFAVAAEGGPAYPLPVDQAIQGIAVFEAITRSAASGRTETTG
jgi:predicted dehydrogenase